MFKFLRKYNKWIMVVGGGLLLLVFLVPTTIQQMSQRSAALGTAWAQLGNTKVSEEDRLRMAGQLQVLEAYDMMEQAAGNMLSPLIQLRFLTGMDPRDPAHWYLLVHEAEQGGFIGGPDEGRMWLQDQALLSGGAVTEAQIIGQLSGASRQSPMQVLEALANMRGVFRMLNVASVLPLSDARAKIALSERETSAAADLVVLDAAMPLTVGGREVPTPDAAAIQAHFEKHRDVLPGEGEHGFGYRVPNRVRLEWFRIPAESVRQSMEQDPRLGELELRKAYLKNPGEFVAPGPDGSSPDFDTVVDEVRARVLDRITRERMSEIERFVEDQLALGLRGVAKRHGYHDLTPEQRDRQTAFADLVATISEQFTIPVPEYHGAGDTWLLIEDVNRIPVLGTAMTTRAGPRPLRVSELLPALREFGGSDTIIVQGGVAGPPLTVPSFSGGLGDVVFFRVVDAEASHAPEALDEAIEQQVVRDLMRLARYEMLVAEAPAIEERAVKEGLPAVATSFGTNVQFMPRISEANPSIAIPGIGPDPAAVSAIMKRAATLPKTAPVADLPDADRTFVVEAPEKLALLVVRITSLGPVTAEDFQRIAASGAVRQRVGDRVPGVMLVDLYGLEPLRARHRFTFAREGGE